jgi:hypothetical protein
MVLERNVNSPSLKAPVTKDEFSLFCDNLVLASAESLGWFWCKEVSKDLLFKKKPFRKCIDYSSHHEARGVSINQFCLTSQSPTGDDASTLTSRLHCAPATVCGGGGGVFMARLRTQQRRLPSS